MHIRLLWGLLIALLPKCGLCLAAYLQLLGIMGVSIAPYFKWLMPALSLLLCASLIVSFIKARKSGSYLGFGLSAMGGTLVLLSKLLLWGTTFTWLGVGLLIFSTLWQAGLNGQGCIYKMKG